MTKFFQIGFAIALFLSTLTIQAFGQSDSIIVKRDIAGIHINCFNPFSIGVEFYPALHHSIGVEGQVLSPAHLKMGSGSRGVQRIYFDYRYFFGKSGTNGLFLGTYAIYKKQHEVQDFADPYYHGIEYEATVEGLWAGGLIGYRKRLPTKLFLSAFFGLAGALDFELSNINNSVSSTYHNSPFTKGYFSRDIRFGGEIGYLF